ncbi:hypothetical protein MAJHIDBO_02265 [Propionibacterium freudenreichii subsp. shermanii]|nr:hypothetical protein MAJHIDBO_02265 [Propionibacterium freudenreichii subsp. shermanii]SPS10046.1 hypothetical protein MAJHIDBO_02265 [Propionibacterium freudenreichii subsp. shermanii]
MITTASPITRRTTRALDRKRPRSSQRTACHELRATMPVRRPASPKARTASRPCSVDRMSCDWRADAWRSLR